MRKALALVLLCFLLSNCSEQDAKKETSLTNDSTTGKDTISEEEYPIDSEYELNYVVSISEGYNYDSLHSIALEAAKILNTRFDSLDRYYNTKRKKIILPENYVDEQWAGEYYFRREADNFVSVEMKNMYADTLTENNEKALEVFTADTLKMFVFAGMSPNKASADSLANLLKLHYKQVQITPTNIFMGCMH